MRLTATRSSLGGSGAVLDPITQEDPTLDLNFADSKALRDDVDGDNPITFRRSSTATYVDADGLIKTTAFNNLTYSERFDQWSKGSSTTITANVAVAPDGKMTADRVEMPATSGSYFNQANRIVSGRQYTGSVWVKAVTPGTNNQFDLKFGSVASSTFTATGEWQRVTATVTAVAA